METDIVQFVQRRLWSNGHKTKRMPEGRAYDLIVDNKHNVKVTREKDPYKIPTFLFDKNNVYAVAVVYRDATGSLQVIYAKKTGLYKRFREATKTERRGKK